MSVGTVLSQAAGRRSRLRSARRASLLDQRAVAAVAGLMLVAALLRFYRLGFQGFWFDEGNTALEVHYSPGQMLTLVKHYESTPPLYYCVAWVWARVFGSGETGLRSLSAACGVLTVPVAYAAAGKLVSRRAGLIAAGLTATNSLLIWYSQEARAYELAVLLGALTLLAFAAVREDGRAWPVAAWVIACALALATEYYAILIVAPEALWLLYLHRSRRALWAGLGALALCCAPLLWFAISQNATGHASWIAHSPLGRRTAELVPQFAAGFSSPGYSVLEPLSLALAIFAIALLFLSRDGLDERRGALLAGALALAGLALNFILIAAGTDDLLTRNVISLWMPAAVAAAGGFAVLGSRRARVAGTSAAIALCAVGAGATIAIARNRDFQRPDWRGVERLLGPRPAAGAAAAAGAAGSRAHPPATAVGRVILIQHYRDLLPLSLYLPDLKFVRGSGARVSELDVVSFSSPPSAGFCWWGSACNLWPSKMQQTYPIPGFRAVSRRRIYQFTVLRMVATHGPVTVTPGLVSPALETTTLLEDDLLVQR